MHQSVLTLSTNTIVIPVHNNRCKEQMQHFLITFKVLNNLKLTTSGNTLFMFWTIITHLKRDSQIRYSVVLRYSQGVGSCEWATLTPRQWQSEISPPRNCICGHMEKLFLMKFESYRLISFWCIKPQGYQNFPTPDFYSTIFPDRFQLESKTERYNNTLHSILQCTVMLRRRKEKIFACPVHKIQEQLWEAEFSVVFHLTTAVHNFDCRLVLKWAPNIWRPEQSDRDSVFDKIMYDFSAILAGGMVVLRPHQGQRFAFDSRPVESYNTGFVWRGQVCCICAATVARRCKNRQQKLYFANWHFSRFYLLLTARMRIFLLYTLLTSDCVHPTTGLTIPVILFILPRNLYFVHNLSHFRLNSKHFNKLIALFWIECSLDSPNPDFSRFSFFRTDELQSRSFLSYIQNLSEASSRHYCTSFQLFILCIPVRCYVFMCVYFKVT